MQTLEMYDGLYRDNRKSNQIYLIIYVIQFGIQILQQKLLQIHRISRQIIITLAISNNCSAANQSRCRNSSDAVIDYYHTITTVLLILYGGFN